MVSFGLFAGLDTEYKGWVVPLTRGVQVAPPLTVLSIVPPAPVT